LEKEEGGVQVTYQAPRSFKLSLLLFLKIDCQRLAYHLKESRSSFSFKKLLKKVNFFMRIAGRISTFKNSFQLTLPVFEFLAGGKGGDQRGTR